jgi:hypothetical protein
LQQKEVVELQEAKLRLAGENGTQSEHGESQAQLAEEVWLLREEQAW